MRIPTIFGWAFLLCLFYILPFAASAAGQNNALIFEPGLVSDNLTGTNNRTAGSTPQVMPSVKLEDKYTAYTAAPYAALSAAIYDRKQQIDAPFTGKWSLVNDERQKVSYQVITDLAPSGIAGTTPAFPQSTTETREDPRGFHASTYKGPNGKISVVFEGTTLTDLPDWLNNISQNVGFVPKQYKMAKEYLDKAIKDCRCDPATDIVVTGHSLGGGMAQYAASISNNNNGTTGGLQSYTFNAAGLGPGSLASIRVNNGDSANIVNIREDHDIVSKTGKLVGQEVIYDFPRSSPLAVHSINPLAKDLLDIVSRDFNNNPDDYNNWLKTKSRLEPDSKIADIRSEAKKEIYLDLKREARQTGYALQTKNQIYQEGKTLIDAFGNRVRVEEYITRPDPSSFQFLALSKKTDTGRIDYYLREVTANKPLPTNLAKAGDLFMSESASKPEYWATKLWTIVASETDNIHLMRLDGDSKQVTLTAGTFGSNATFWTTIFGNSYEFINGNPGALSEIRTGNYRPFDNTSITGGYSPNGNPVTGMMWHMQPVHTLGRNDGGATGDDLWWYAFATQNGGVGANGKLAATKLLWQDATGSSFNERVGYYNFTDSNGNGVGDFGEMYLDNNGISGRQAGEVWFDITQRYTGNWSALTAVNAAGENAGTRTCQAPDQYFSDTVIENNLPDPGEPSLGQLPVNNPWAWVQASNYLLSNEGWKLGLSSLDLSEFDRVASYSSLERVITGDSKHFQGNIDPMFFWPSSESAADSISTLLGFSFPLSDAFLGPSWFSAVDPLSSPTMY